jgi:hypothetical protein
MSESGDNSRISNQETPGTSETPQSQSGEAAKLEDHKISLGTKIKEWLWSITFFGLGKLFSKVLTSRTTAVVDSDAPIEKRLPSLVKTDQEGNTKILIDMFLRLEPNALKDVFIDGKKGS